MIFPHRNWSLLSVFPFDVWRWTTWSSLRRIPIWFTRPMDISFNNGIFDNRIGPVRHVCRFSVRRIKCLQSKSNCLLTSSFDERTNLIDLRQPTQPLLVYDSSTSSLTNPHFTFTIDHGSEHFLAACSQHHIAHVWDLPSGRLLNRFRCPIPERLVHSSSKCAIACVAGVPHLGIYHPEYTRLSDSQLT